MALPHELTREESERLLRSGDVGRVAVCTPGGPHVIPVNYTVMDRAVVFRTSPYSEVGTHARDAQIAFEVDHVDRARKSGWSVLARGRAVPVTSHEEVAEIRAAWPQGPWAEGIRNIYLRLRWVELSGRSLGEVSAEPAAVEDAGTQRP